MESNEEIYKNNAKSHNWVFVKIITFKSSLEFSMKDFKCINCGLRWFTNVDKHIPTHCDYSCSEYLIQEVLE